MALDTDWKRTSTRHRHLDDYHMQSCCCNQVCGHQVYTCPGYCSPCISAQTPPGVIRTTAGVTVTRCPPYQANLKVEIGERRPLMSGSNPLTRTVRLTPRPPCDRQSRQSHSQPSPQVLPGYSLLPTPRLDQSRPIPYGMCPPEDSWKAHQNPHIHLSRPTLGPTALPTRLKPSRQCQSHPDHPPDPSTRRTPAPAVCCRRRTELN